MKTFEEIKKNPKLEILRTGIDGGSGILHMTGLRHCTVIWSFGGGWEHVSIFGGYVKNGVYQMPEV